MRSVIGIFGYFVLVHLAWSADGALERFLAWNEANLRAVELASPSPCLVARNLAIIHGAAFEAMNAVKQGHERSIPSLPSPPLSTDPEIAVLSAAYHASKALFPSYRATFDQLWEAQFRVLEARSGAKLSVRFGREVAKACLQNRVGDGSSATITYYPKDAIGKWRRTAPRYRPPELPHWPKVTPFVLQSAQQFRPPPPPAMHTPEYAAAVNEVKALGRARTPSEQGDREAKLAHFWSCFNYTATPSGHWNEIASYIARSRELELEQATRVFAVLNLALADAGVAAWDAKYHYEFWRPIQAIRRAGEDGNYATEPDPEWESELEAPPHPEYVSGHSAFSGAGARILARLFATDKISFATTSSSLPGVELPYDSLEACGEEIGMSRLYGGIHFRFSNEQGLILGRRVADWVYANAYPKTND
jgi:hypothetical protein